MASFTQVSAFNLFRILPFATACTFWQKRLMFAATASGGGGTLGISGWGCAAGTLEPLTDLTYTRASSAEFCYPILELTPQIPPILE